MSIEQQIVDLEALASVDTQIKALSEQLESQRSQIAGVRGEVDELGTGLETDRAAIIEMDKTRQDLMQELRQIDQQMSRSRERLNRARNEREQNAAERELDELRKLHRDRDDEVKKVTALADQARATVAANEKRLGELTGELEGSLPKATESMSSLDEQLGAQQELRGAAAAKLPSLLRRRYQGMLDRGKTPVAYTTDGTCQGCFVKLPPMLFHNMLSRIRFEECPFCHRILYYRLASEATAEEATADDGAGDDGAGDDGAANDGADADDAAGSTDEKSSSAEAGEDTASESSS